MNGLGLKWHDIQQLEGKGLQVGFFGDRALKCSRYVFLSCLSLFMIRYSGILDIEEPHLYCGDDAVREAMNFTGLKE